MGALPDNLKGLTIPERLTTQVSTVAATTRVMRGGRHRCIRWHCLAFDCTPGPPLLLLPRSLEDVTSYRIVMAGYFTEGQVRKVRKMHRNRNGIVRGVFSFYKTHNNLYDNVMLSTCTRGCPRLCGAAGVSAPAHGAASKRGKLCFSCLTR
ncbi:hypothetical protein JG687_00003206 [Phytophthora cactorum]|uniref:DUF6570 domain-containing protein n=1 Tax=Phytophthora cactorum TaxID=29920 RepID=A0A8T1UT13_9STRA|nr:hypothetical protein JG687_00003206 [Phytophthora cactorum]